MVLLTGVVIWRVLVTPPDDVLDDEPFHQGVAWLVEVFTAAARRLAAESLLLKARTASSTERVLARPSPSVVS